MTALWHDILTSNVPLGCVFYIWMLRLLDKQFTGPENRWRYEQHRVEWKTLMIVYNVFMSLYSFVTFVMSFSIILSIPLFTEDITLLYRQPGWEWICYLFYCSKYVEFIDSFFLVIAGKGVSPLQYFHHIGAVIVMRALYAMRLEGIWLFVVFNSLVHTGMYAWYAGSIAKLSCVRFWKQPLTILQLIQLLTGIIVCWVYVSLPWCAWNRENLWNYWTVDNLTAFALNVSYLSILLGFFIRFYRETYRHRKTD